MGWPELLPRLRGAVLPVGSDESAYISYRSLSLVLLHGLARVASAALWSDLAGRILYLPLAKSLAVFPTFAHDHKVVR